MIVVLLLPTNCIVWTVTVSLVTLTTYPSASDESNAVQLTVTVVPVLLIMLREVGAESGTVNEDNKNSEYCDRLTFQCHITSSIYMSNDIQYTLIVLSSSVCLAE